MSIEHDQALVRQVNDQRKRGELEIVGVTPGKLAYAVFYTALDGSLQVHGYYRTPKEAKEALSEHLSLHSPRRSGPCYVEVERVPDTFSGEQIKCYDEEDEEETE